ncbi:hypothetical protein, partial [Candidatus Raskinella chloraquaticus]
MARAKSEAGARSVRRQVLGDVVRGFVAAAAQGPLRRMMHGWSPSAPMVAVPNPLRAGNLRRGESLLAGKFTVAGRIIENEA